MSGPVDPTLTNPEPQLDAGQLPLEAGLGADNLTDPGEPPQDSSEVDWKKRYADSQRGFQSFQAQTKAELDAIRQRAEQAEQSAQMLQFQMMQAAQQRPVPVQQQATPEFISAAEAKEIADAQLEGNYTKAQQLQNAAMARAVQSVQYQQQTQQQQAAQAMAALNRVQQLVPDFGKDQQISKQLVMQAQQMRWQNPYLSEVDALREAAVDWALTKGRAVSAAQERARQSADIQAGEPARATAKATPGDQKATSFNESTHLSKGEREYVEMMHARDPKFTAARYFKGLDPEVQAARLKEGRPVSKRQVA